MVERTLSHWERNIYFREVDLTIIGAGLVGLCTGIAVLERYPDRKVLILERTAIALGASSRNAGFICYGSPTELMDDLKHHPPEEVFGLFQRRYAGVRKLLDIIGKEDVDWSSEGGHELLHSNLPMGLLGQDDLDFLNLHIEKGTGLKNYFYFDNERLKKSTFRHFDQWIANDHEAGVHPLKIVLKLEAIFRQKGGRILHGVTIGKWREENSGVWIENDAYPSFFTKKLLFCVNGFAPHFFPGIDVRPARNRVLLIRSEQVKIPEGCFHVDRGFIYFRKLGSALLIGGGRHLDIEHEYRDDFGYQPRIEQYLLDFAVEHVLENGDFIVEDRWTGIMGMGSAKSPIVKMVSPHTGVAVRMGGMGLALASTTGEEACQMIYSQSE